MSTIRDSWPQRVMAAILSGAPTALASHRCAARLWNLEGIRERPVEISIKAGRRIRGVIVHRRRASDDPATEILDGIPATGIERTLLDLAAVVAPDRAGLAIDDALRRGLTTLEDLRSALSLEGRRQGIGSFRALLDARDHRDALLESSLESELLQIIRRSGLPLPIPQYTVVQKAEVAGRLDFAYPAHRLGLEADGFRWHTGRERWSRDRRRENKLKLLSWTLLRFSLEDLRNTPDDVAHQISSALRMTEPTLSR